MTKGIGWEKEGADIQSNVRVHATNAEDNFPLFPGHGQSQNSEHNKRQERRKKDKSTCCDISILFLHYWYTLSIHIQLWVQK